MAGDWIKVQTCTPDKPEVHLIAEQLGIDPDAVTGKLIRIWCWADQQTIDGNAVSVTKTLLDRVACVTGFAQCLLKVGWLVETDSGFQFPNFDRHNGNSAKTRALSAKRTEKHRKTAPVCNAPSVTTALPEKRREEKSISLYSLSENADVFIPEKLRTPEVESAAQLWWSHLRLEHPDKLPEPNSPQLQAFWNDASRMGPTVFIEAVNWSAKNHWATLNERPPQRNQGSNQKPGKVLQDF
jgi:hypothetical protein